MGTRSVSDRVTRSTIIEFNGIGPVLFEYSTRARHVSISIKPHKGVRIAVPLGVTFEKAQEIIHLKKNWIQKHLARMRQMELNHDNLLHKLSRTNRVEAKKKLVDRLNKLAEKHGFTYNRVSIRNQKTRWGSCSPSNNLSLNFKLVVLPKELVDYVLLHELVHTRIKNHRREFWHILEGLVGDAKARRSQIKKYQLI